jgi:hypothetical protein
MITHKEAEALFQKCRDKDRGHKLAGNTYIRKRGRAFAVQLHDTDIIIIAHPHNYQSNEPGTTLLRLANQWCMVCR